jgi:hypothetical protein
MLAIGGMLGLGALTAFGLFGGLAALAGGSGEPDAEIGAWLLGAVGTAVGTLMILLAVPVFACAIGLFKSRRWARYLGIFIAACALVDFPYGTVFGAYALWVLFNARSRALFDAAAA